MEQKIFELVLDGEIKSSYDPKKDETTILLSEDDITYTYLVLKQEVCQ